jgi:hypothetical protein
MLGHGIKKVRIVYILLVASFIKSAKENSFALLNRNCACEMCGRPFIDIC